MATNGGPNIVTDGSVLALDAASPRSYQGSGTKWNDIVNNNSGTLTNGPTYSSTKSGIITFDNTNDYVALPNSLGYTTQVSAFAWIRVAGNPAGGYHIIFGGQELEISIPTAGSLRVGVYTNTRYVSNHGSGLADGEWHYIGFTFNGSTKTAYIDGTSVGTQAVSGTLTSTFSNRTMGRYGSSTTYYLNGSIASAAIYNRSLTSDEVLQNYNATKHRFK